MSECPLCSNQEFDKAGFVLHAFTHMIEHNREILHIHNNKDGYMIAFIQACRNSKLNTQEIEKIRPQAEYLIEANLKK